MIFTSKNSINIVSLVIFFNIFLQIRRNIKESKLQYSAVNITLYWIVLISRMRAFAQGRKKRKLYIIHKKNTENNGKFQKLICRSPFQLGEKKSSF